MNLWIRSQDKMILVKINDININYQNNKQIIANYIAINKEADFYIILGTYKTKKRAIEVLDEIQEKIINICKFQLVNENYECDNCVYEMPEE